jgi:biopolymer transport protein ExbD
MRRRATSLPEARLELAPLIDVVFVLLAFFILALVVTTRLELTEILLPEARAGERDPASPGRTVIVALTPGGEVRVGEERVAMAEVGARARAALEALEGAELVIAPDRDAPAGRLLELMDEMSASGFPDLRVLRLPAPEGEEGR